LISHRARSGVVASSLRRQLPQDLEQGDENRSWRDDSFLWTPPAHDGETIRFCRNNGGIPAPKQDHGAAYMFLIEQADVQQL
jgi:hypothetical protein